MLICFLVLTNIYLLAKIVILKSLLGGLNEYMQKNKYPIPTNKEMTEWGKRYIKKYFAIETGS